VICILDAISILAGYISLLLHDLKPIEAAQTLAYFLYSEPPVNDVNTLCAEAAKPAELSPVLRNLWNDARFRLFAAILAMLQFAKLCGSKGIQPVVAVGTVYVVSWLFNETLLFMATGSFLRQNGVCPEQWAYATDRARLEGNASHLRTTAMQKAFSHLGSAVSLVQEFPMFYFYVSRYHRLFPIKFFWHICSGIAVDLMHMFRFAVQLVTWVSYDGLIFIWLYKAMLCTTMGSVIVWFLAAAIQTGAERYSDLRILGVGLAQVRGVFAMTGNFLYVAGGTGFSGFVMLLFMLFIVAALPVTVPIVFLAFVSLAVLWMVYVEVPKMLMCLYFAAAARVVHEGRHLLVKPKLIVRCERGFVLCTGVSAVVYFFYFYEEVGTFRYSWTRYLG